MGDKLQARLGLVNWSAPRYDPREELRVPTVYEVGWATEMRGRIKSSSVDCSVQGSLHSLWYPDPY
jgi:hypothetical protein